MARTIYTERDIEEMARRGIREVQVNDEIYLTDLARERMQALGIKARIAGPEPAAQADDSGPAAAGALSEAEKDMLAEKVKSGVIARLGAGVDVAVVDSVVRRVISQL